MKLWQKNYKLDKKIEDFTVSEDYLIDQKLVKYDCLASIAHVKTLGKAKLLKKQEAEKIVKELKKIISLDQSGQFQIKKSQEDCHTAIENYLTKKLGNLGQKIHTARSRNDQVLAALHLFYKDEIDQVIKLLENLVKSIGKFQKQFGSIKLAGYTHTRKAMPSSIKLWSDSLDLALQENKKLLKDSFKLIDQCPLGSGAGYGLPVKIDSQYCAKLLCFAKQQQNPIQVQNSRGKYAAHLVHLLSLIMYDLNKLASDLIIFSLPELGYFVLPKEFCTGSSIMPQKKNPDVLEIIRGNYHLVQGLEFTIKGLMSDLPAGYNRDLQLSKKPTIESFSLTKNSLNITSLLFQKLKVDKEKCHKSLTAEVFATQEVYKLVEKGLPFRKAYQKVAKKY